MRLIKFWLLRGAWLASCVGLCLLGACIATETGNPSITVDSSGLQGTVLPDDPMLPAPPAVVIDADPGAVDPPGGEVYGWPLENNLPPTNAEVQPDGSFLLDVVALPDAPVRLQVRGSDGEFSTPVDVRVSAERGLSEVPLVNGCLELDPVRLAYRAGAGEITITIHNRCDEPVTRSSARLREGHTALTLSDDGPLEIAAAGTSQVRVQVSGPALDIVLVPIVAPQPELRAVTILTE